MLVFAPINILNNPEDFASAVDMLDDNTLFDSALLLALSSVERDWPLRYPHKISIKNNALLDKIWIKIRFKSV